jgi:hypothetical protein
MRTLWALERLTTSSVPLTTHRTNTAGVGKCVEGAACSLPCCAPPAAAASPQTVPRMRSAQYHHRCCCYCCSRAWVCKCPRRKTLYDV